MKMTRDRMIAQKIGLRCVDGLLVVDVCVGVGTVVVVVVVVVVRAGLESGIIVFVSLG